MKKEIIDNSITKNYVEAINSITEPMNVIKEEVVKYMGSHNDKNNSMNKLSEAFKETSEKKNFISNGYLKNISTMIEAMKKVSKIYPKEQTTVILDTIREIMRQNNEIIYTRLIEPLNISRQYLSILEKNKEIEKISRGIYINPNTIQDDFYLFQLKYKKTIFSHMNALYFYGLTEEIPYNFTVTVVNNYHVSSLNENCNVFYVDENIYELGICEVKTPNGNTVKTYDLERSICDIIRCKNRMDFEQVKKSIRLYVKSKNKNMLNLSKYAKEMNITNEVMEMVGMYYE